jgi:hypothetical protein
MPMRTYERFSARAAVTTALVALAAIVSPQSAFAGPAASARAAAIHGSLAPAPGPQGHLYVLDVSSLAVYRFPLGPDGLPATSPDGTLKLVGARDPQGLAVDPSGHIFVADPVTQVVSEYAAGANGPQPPISTLNLFGYGPFHLKMDSAERLYIEYGANQNQSIGIYAKGAQGADQPMSVIAPYYDPELAADYVITPSGTLYILDWSTGAGIIGYSNVFLNSAKGYPSAPDIFMQLQGPGGPLGEFDPGYSMAFDDETSQLYFQFLPQDNGLDMDFAVRKVPYSGYPTERDSMLYSKRCPAQYGQSGGAVIAKEYLIVSCEFDPEVLVYRKDRFGIRNPVEIAGRGTLGGPSQIAIGP